MISISRPLYKSSIELRRPGTEAEQRTGS